MENNIKTKHVNNRKEYILYKDDKSHKISFYTKLIKSAS